jgi:acyl transferase domain-containing protein
MKREPIAIVGISCRFPQAKNIAEFWNLLMEEKDTIEDMNNERWNIDQYYDEDIQTPNKTNQRHGSFLKAIYDFDPYFFNISPAEATEMSPSQKLMLELAWEAIEHSNIPVNRLKGKHAGVYVGNVWSDYEHFRKSIHSNVTSHTAIGQSSNAVANRISYALGFTGPSLVVDTGCSSSLVALHLACQSLWDQSLDYAVTGGVNHLLDPDQYVMLTKFGGLSSKGKCSTFDAEADGFVRGEGGGLIILKRLSDAERDHDKIYAVIRSSSMNNNGFNESFPATKTEAQIEMFREAYESCGIKPSDVHYVEAHGTGTRMGDPNECNAIGKYFSTGRSEDRKLHIGSVKTNIGHLEGAAGIAGLIKVVLSMWHRKLPKSLNFKTPNPKIPFEELKLKVQDTCDNWPVRESETFKAGVNSFGWGGTNAHAVIEEYRYDDSCIKCYDRKNDRSVLTLSARSESALRQYAEKYKVLLSENVNGSKSLFEDICVATNVTKPGFEFRFSAHAASKQEMISKLEDFIHDEMPVAPVNISEPSKIVFVFPGQGSQWEGMGRKLYEKEMVFRDTIDEFDRAFKNYVDWSLKDEIFGGKETSRMHEINVVQPMLFAMEVGLARLWTSFGIVADAVVGHSMGEVASALFAGVLSTDDAARIICTRSLLMKKVSGKGGAMAVTELTLEEASKMADEYQGKVSVAVNNSPKSTVIAGDENTVLKIIDRLDKEDLFCRQINVDVASHSPQMEPLKEELREALKAVKPSKATTDLYSTVLDGKVSGEELNADYWANNLRGMVQFSSVVQQMIRDDHQVFIEVSPHPVLTNAIHECGEATGKKTISTGSLFRDAPETESIYTNICALFSKGHNISWDAFYGIRKIPFVELPGYPMQRETFKLEDRSEKMAILSGGNANPLIGKKIDLAGIENISVWENVLSLENPVFLNDYKIHETTVFPVSAYLEMLQEAILERFGQGNHVVQDVQYRKAILVPDDETVGIQLRFELINEKKVGFKFFFKISNGQNGQEWDLSAEGEIHLNVSENDAECIEKVKFDIEKLIAIEDGHDYYESLKDLGLFYGEQFSNIIWMGKMEESVIAEVMPSARIRREQEKFNLHPALLDAAFQVMYADLIWNDNNHSDKTTYYTSIGKYRFVHAMTESTNLVVKAEVKNVGKTDKSNRYMISADVKVFDDQSTLLCEFYDLKSEVIDNNKKATFYTQSPINVREEKHQKDKKNDKGVYDLIMESKDEKLRLEILHDHLKKSLATVTKAAVSRISLSMTFKGMGVDSLMAVKLRKSIEESLNVRFPVTAFWGHPTINEFALFIRDKINVDKDPAPEDKEVRIPVSENGCPLNIQESQPATFVKCSDLEIKKFDNMTINELENEIDKELDELL